MICYVMIFRDTLPPRMTSVFPDGSTNRRLAYGFRRGKRESATFPEIC